MLPTLANKSRKKLKKLKKIYTKILLLGSAYNYRVPPKSSHTMEYVKALCGDSWLELFKIGNFKDDKAMIGKEKLMANLL
jgi:acetyl-CoA carboxylase carboxyl transferase subunit alpha